MADQMTPRHAAARTCDHLLCVVWLHVAVVLPQALGIPLPFGAFGIVGVGVVLQDDDLGEGGWGGGTQQLRWAPGMLSLLLDVPRRDGSHPPQHPV